MQGYPALVVALLAAVGVSLAVSYLSKKGSDEKSKGLPFLYIHTSPLPLPLSFVFLSLLLLSLSLSGPPAPKPKKGPVALVPQKKAAYKMTEKEVYYYYTYSGTPVIRTLIETGEMSFRTFLEESWEVSLFQMVLLL